MSACSQRYILISPYILTDLNMCESLWQARENLDSGSSSKNIKNDELQEHCF